jgi:proline dehydrogenase
MSWFNKVVARTLPVVPKPIVRRVSSRYIAGETLDEALDTVARLNREGMMATLDVLGEFVATAEEARRAGNEYHRALRAIAERKVDSNVSLKLTQMGLAIDPELCYQVCRGVVEEAIRLGNFVRIDMEDSTCTDATLAVHERLRREFPAHVGCAVQAYLKRSLDDVRALVSGGANVRLCKGIYIEPARIAYKDHDAINRNYALLLRELLAGGCYAGIATHDEALVDAAYDIIGDLGLSPDRYEFQMLLGVTENLRGRILARGHRLRVYVPFGSHWYAYSLRRLKENPQVAGHIMKNMLNGNT